MPVITNEFVLSGGGAGGGGPPTAPEYTSRIKIFHACTHFDCRCILLRGRGRINSFYLKKSYEVKILKGRGVEFRYFFHSEVQSVSVPPEPGSKDRCPESKNVTRFIGYRPYQRTCGEGRFRAVRRRAGEADQTAPWD